MENIFAIGIIVLLIIHIYGQSETKKSKTKLDKKQKYMVKVINKLTDPTKSVKPIKPISDSIKPISDSIKPIPDLVKPTICNKTMKLISAYTVGGSDDNYNNQHISSKLLQSIDMDEIKGRDFIKTNFVDIEKSVIAGPSPSPSPGLASVQNEIIGITNAPMYAPVESIDKSVDIFLINQINTTKNNSVSYIDHPIITSNNKMNYIKNNSLISLINSAKSIENVDGYSMNEFKHSSI